MGFTNKNTSQSSQDLLFIDILKVISISGIYLIHLISTLKLNQFNFLPSGNGFEINLNNFFNGQK
jgi:hypothetical protein